MKKIGIMLMVILMGVSLGKAEEQQDVKDETVQISKSADPAVVEEKEVISMDLMPPVVISTLPQAGDIMVDPKLKEIKVTFSKDMMRQEMWSWVMVSKDSFPAINGNIKFLEDGRTCVAPVELVPNKTYAIWFNSKNHSGFRCINGYSAVPYLLVFRTKAE